MTDMGRAKGRLHSRSPAVMRPRLDQSARTEIHQAACRRPWPSSAPLAMRRGRKGWVDDCNNCIFCMALASLPASLICASAN